LNTFSVHSFLLFFFTGLMLSCIPKSPQVTSPVSVPEHFSISGKAQISDQWWISFNDPELNRLVNQALSSNFSLRSAWDRLAQKEALSQREGAARSPTLDFQANASRTETHGSAGTLTTGQRSRSFERFFVGLSTNYELDLWGRIRSTHEAAKLDLRASEEDLQAAAMTLSAQVALSWFQLVEQYGQLELLASQLKTNGQVLELVTFRFRQGQVGATDVLQQRQLIEASRGDMSSARSKATVLEHQLAILLGQAPNLPISAQQSKLTTMPPLPDTGLPAELIRRRPDIRSAYFKLLAADQTLSAAITNRFPRISLTAQINSSGQAVRDLFDNWLTTLAANLIGPIIDGGSRRAEVKRTRALLSERLNDYGQVILEALGEIENAMVQEQEQHQLIESLEKQLKISRQVLEQTRENYRQGGADFLRILDVLLTQQALERSLLQARREEISFRVNLYRALGGGWKLNSPLQIGLAGKRNMEQVK